MKRVTILEHTNGEVEIRFLDHRKTTVKQITISVTDDVFDILQNGPFDIAMNLARSILNNPLYENHTD